MEWGEVGAVREKLAARLWTRWGLRQFTATDELAVIAGSFAEGVMSDEILHRRRHVIPSSAFQYPARLFLVLSAPLLEEKGYVGGQALVADFRHPFRLHLSRSRPGLATYNHPIDIVKDETAQRTEERFQ